MLNVISIEFDVFVDILYGIEILVECFVRDDHRATTIVGVEREERSIAKGLVEEQVDMMLGVVDQSER